MARPDLLDHDPERLAALAAGFPESPATPNPGVIPSPMMSTLAPPPRMPTGSRPPSIYDPSPEAFAEYERQLGEYQAAQQVPKQVAWGGGGEFDAIPAPADPGIPGKKNTLLQATAAPQQGNMEALTQPDFGAQALQRAIREQRQGDAVSQILGGLTQAVTGGRAQANLPGSTALQDFMTQRNAAVQDRNRRLLEERQGRTEGRQEEAHRFRMADMERQFEEAQADAGLREQLRDPESEASQRARDSYTMMGRTLDVEGIDQIVEGRSAWELRNDPEVQSMMDYATRVGLIDRRGSYTKFGRRAGRGGVRGLGRGRRAEAEAENPAHGLYIQERISRGDSPEQAEQRWQAVSQDKIAMRGILTSLGRDDFSTTGGRADENRVRDLSKREEGISNVTTALDMANEEIRALGESDFSLGERTALQGVAMGGVAGALAGNLSDRARIVGGIINELGTAILREESGAAISEQEWADMRQRLGVAAAQGPRQFQEAINRIKRLVEARRARLRAGYTPEERATYDARVQEELGTRGPEQAPGPSGVSAGISNAGARTVQARVVAPDGTEEIREITRDQANELIEEGYRVTSP